jgi:hypothetical protein
VQTEELGFYYMVYQPNPPKERVRAWLDGDPACKYYSYDSLMKLIPHNMQAAIKKSLMEYSLFLWDVHNEGLRRLSSKGGKIPIGEWIKNKKTEGAVEEPLSIEDQYWNRDYTEDGLIIKK